MITKQLEVFGLGPLKATSHEFAHPGLDIILGPNESGKSTLCDAMMAIMFGFSSKSDAAQKQSWEDNTRCEGKLLLEIRGRVISIQWNFGSDHTRVVELVDDQERLLFDGDANPRGRTEEPKAYARLLTEELGLPSEDIIRNSAYLGQMALQVQLDEDLRRQISGAGKADYKRAREDLRQHYYSLTKNAVAGDRNRPGDRKIEHLQDRLAALRIQLRGARKMFERFGSYADNYQELAKEKQESERRAHQLQEEIKNLDRYLGLQERRKDVAQRENLEQQPRDQIIGLQGEVEKIRGELGSKRFAPIANLETEHLDSLRQYLKSDAEELTYLLHFESRKDRW